jgi:hypothetical protein
MSVSDAPINYAKAIGIESFPLALIFCAIYVPLFIVFMTRWCKNVTYVLGAAALFSISELLFLVQKIIRTYPCGSSCYCFRNARGSHQERVPLRTQELRHCPVNHLQHWLLRRAIIRGQLGYRQVRYHPENLYPSITKFMIQRGSGWH